MRHNLPHHLLEKAIFSAPNNPTNPLTYRASGVDIDAGNTLVERIRSAVAKTARPEVLQGLGGFGALFELPLERYRHPVLVSGTDGVGTKIRLAAQLNNHRTIGIDLVAMCVNDIIVSGAEPLYFLDYFATSKLDVAQAEQVISGIAQGCEQAGCALIGGETAEMPRMYHPGEYDLAGFAVGVVEKNAMLNPAEVAPGDKVIGLAASGVHANGFSLIHAIIERSGADLEQPFAPTPQTTLGQLLLTPTRIYVPAVLRLLQLKRADGLGVTAIAHITGGGLVENIPRVLPPTVGVSLDAGSWARPPIFNWLQHQGNIPEAEMRRTFNCGIGMVICVRPEAVDRALESLTQSGESASVIGEVSTAQPGQVTFRD